MGQTYVVLVSIGAVLIAAQWTCWLLLRRLRQSPLENLAPRYQYKYLPIALLAIRFGFLLDGVVLYNYLSYQHVGYSWVLAVVGLAYYMLTTPSFGAGRRRHKMIAEQRYTSANTLVDVVRQYVASHPAQTVSVEVSEDKRGLVLLWDEGSMYLAADGESPHDVLYALQASVHASDTSPRPKRVDVSAQLTRSNNAKGRPYPRLTGTIHMQPPPTPKD